MAEVMSLKDKLAMFNKKIDKQSEEAQHEKEFSARASSKQKEGQPKVVGIVRMSSRTKRGPRNKKQTHFEKTPEKQKSYRKKNRKPRSRTRVEAELKPKEEKKRSRSSGNAAPKKMSLADRMAMFNKPKVESYKPKHSSIKPIRKKSFKLGANKKAEPKKETTTESKKEEKKPVVANKTTKPAAKKSNKKMSKIAALQAKMGGGIKLGQPRPKPKPRPVAKKTTETTTSVAGGSDKIKKKATAEVIDDVPKATAGMSRIEALKAKMGGGKPGFRLPMPGMKGRPRKKKKVSPEALNPPTMGNLDKPVMQKTRRRAATRRKRKKTALLDLED